MNAAAILFHLHGDVGLSFFPSCICQLVKSQGWNDNIDHPVMAGEEQLDAALKPFAEDSNMLKMFDFSKMDDTPLKVALQNSGHGPVKDNPGNDNPLPLDLQALANCNAFSLASWDQMPYYQKDSTPRPVRVSFGDETTLGLDADVDDFMIRSDKDFPVEQAEEASISEKMTASNWTDWHALLLMSNVPRKNSMVSSLVSRSNTAGSNSNRWYFWIRLIKILRNCNTKWPRSSTPYRPTQQPVESTRRFHHPTQPTVEQRCLHRQARGPQGLWDCALMAVPWVRVKNWLQDHHPGAAGTTTGRYGRQQPPRWWL